jgi:hypothetical protein
MMTIRCMHCYDPLLRTRESCQVEIDSPAFSWKPKPKVDSLATRNRGLRVDHFGP